MKVSIADWYGSLWRWAETEVKYIIRQRRKFDNGQQWAMLRNQRAINNEVLLQLVYFRSLQCVQHSKYSNLWSKRVQPKKTVLLGPLIQNQAARLVSPQIYSYIAW